MLRGACNAKGLEAICRDSRAFRSSSERQIVVLADRMQEDCLRHCWHELMRSGQREAITANDSPVGRSIVDLVQLQRSEQSPPSRQRKKARRQSK